MITKSGPILEVKGLSKIFGEGCTLCLVATGPEYETNICPHCGSVVACGDITFELDEDEILGVVGESGSGKSTLVKLLYFDDQATSGAMYIRKTDQRLGNTDLTGKNILSLSPFQKRQIRNISMGMVYQNPHFGLKMGASSGGNISERLIMAGWRSIDSMRKRSSSLLQKTEIPVQRMDEPPKNFSGGMQQRIQIAKALSNNPLILFLDEVTIGLDLSVQARVLDLIRSLQREFHLSVVIVSHDLGVIRLLITRTMVMKFGRVVESGLTDQILEDPQHPYTQLLLSSQL